jgi:hypothetical protein
MYFINWIFSFFNNKETDILLPEGEVHGYHEQNKKKSLDTIRKYNILKESDYEYIASLSNTQTKI